MEGNSKADSGVCFIMNYTSNIKKEGIPLI